MTETGYARILLDKKDTQIMKLESEITKLRIEYESQIMKLLKKNKELEKENAELKKVKQVKIEVTRDYKKLAKDLQEQGNQLTKAKFLLKQLVDAFPKSYSDVVKDTLDEARKFVEE